ncbi:hypothetical protein O9929_16230 [Vibrio lentus]|nr:hypothetical protein [Vibrio lentus]
MISARGNRLRQSNNTAGKAKNAVVMWLPRYYCYRLKLKNEAIAAHTYVAYIAHRLYCCVRISSNAYFHTDSYVPQLGVNAVLPRMANLASFSLRRSLPLLQNTAAEQRNGKVHVWQQAIFVTP